MTPKHTDEEYERLETRLRKIEVSTSMDYLIKLEARIKELEAENARMKKDFDSIDWDYEQDPWGEVKEAKQ